MLNPITKSLTKLFGTKYDRDLKQLYPYISIINAEFEKLKSISDEELRQQTFQLKEQINQYLKDIDDRISSLNEKGRDSALNVHEKEAIYNEVDELEKKRNERLEEILKDLLPKGFAVVKETARRFKENGSMTVKATIFDKELAAKKNNIEINGEEATWHGTWEVAGTDVKWDMVHYDVQLIGGVVLHQGKIAEMATGEGKTLVATLPAYLNALAGRGVHIVTVNDYLAKRDTEWMAPIFEFHHLTIDCIDKFRASSPERRAAYNADITYGTNNEFGFDFLRDNNSTHHPNELVQRKHHFAMVDEVDSVLIDDARTPLIISGPVPRGDEHEFTDLKPKVQELFDKQRKIVGNFLNDAKRLIKEGKEKEGGLSLFRAHRGLPKYKPLIKFLGEQGMKSLLQKTENIYLAENQKLMPEADEPLLFTIDEKTNSVDLTEKGIELITGEDKDKDFFILPDIAVDIDRIEKDPDLDDRTKVEQKDELVQEFSKKSQRIHSVNQLLKAYTMFENDVDYIVQKGKVMIVDEQTGRVMEGRRYSDGLHQAIEAKENVKIEDATQTYATITLQNYFRQYHKLSGMTGTAETEAGEFWEIYKLDVVVIPTNKPIVRDDRHDLVFKTTREKFNAVIDETDQLVKKGRPVLIGTTSVDVSEVFSRMLHMRGIKHQVLNAKQHAKEADVVANAGKPGTVTIATNMAGRGTDIKLAPEAKEAGGLAIVGTERHESRRVDRQLRGRAGRQGDPGSSQFYVSMEDNLMRLFGSERIAKVMDRMGYKEGEVIQHKMISGSIERAQKKVEENNFAIRKRLLEYDDVMNAQREVIYKRRGNALYGDRLEMDILTSVLDRVEEIVDSAKVEDDADLLRMEIISAFGFDTSIQSDDLKKDKNNKVVDHLFQEAIDFLKRKNDSLVTKVLPVIKEIKENRGATVELINIPFTDGKRVLHISSNLNGIIESEGKSLLLDLQKYISLAFIDQLWKDHLREMDDLKQSVRNASYEQKDPLLIYKFEGFELFKNLIGKVNEEITSFLFKCDVAVENPEDVREGRRETHRPKYQENKAEAQSALGSGRQGAAQAPEQKAAPQVAPRKSQKVYGRNDKVTVQYSDGKMRKDVKYKTVEQDVLSNQCVILEESK